MVDITLARAEPILSTIPAFIEPASRALRAAPPVGPSWRHEVKFDGWRVQVWKRGNVVGLLSRRGHDISHRAPSVQGHQLAVEDTRDFWPPSAWTCPTDPARSAAGSRSRHSFGCPAGQERR